MSFDLIGNLRLVDSMSRPLRSAMGNAVKMTGAMAGLGAAITAVGVAQQSINKAMDFEAQIDSISALDKSLARGQKGYQQISQLALDMGSKTSFNALEAAQGIEELIKAGLSAEQVLGGGLEAALNLASAGSLDVASSANVMSIAMNAFKKDMLSPAQAADILASSANSSTLDVNNLRLGIAAVGSVATSLGLTFKDTAAAIAIFGNNGLSASDGGTSLKTFLSRLQPTTKATRTLFEDLGLTTRGMNNQFFDAKGNVKDLASISGVLQKALKGQNAMQRSATLQTLFGSDAIRSASILYAEGAKGVAKFNKSVKEGPTALEVATNKMRGAKSAVEQFQGAIETLQISALQPLMPVIRNLALEAQQLVAKWTPRITAAVTKAVSEASAYLNTHFINNPEFNKIPDINGKINFVFEDIQSTLSSWWSNGGGSDKFREFGKTSATMMGSAFGSALVASPELAFVLGAYIAGTNPNPIGLTIGLSVAMTPQVKRLVDWLMGGLKELNGSASAANLKGYAEWANNTPDGQPMIKGETSLQAPPEDNKPSIYSKVKGALGFASGLDRVPYNNMPARLHKDEAVLTKSEASNWRDQQRGSGSSSGNTININIQASVRNDSDMSELASRIADHIYKHPLHG